MLVPLHNQSADVVFGALREAANASDRAKVRVVVCLR